ncbi:hypothetical protein RZS08_56820, partial [Arthrospira platensis SPKY1]|nr:hypothetical protein [Arthrospira platensis SPKY1]
MPVCQKILHSFSARLPQFRTQVSIFNQFLTFRRALAHEKPYPVCQKILHAFSAWLRGSARKPLSYKNFSFPQ